MMMRQAQILATVERKEVYLHGKPIGAIYGEVYITHRSQPKHFFRKLGGYPVSLYVLDMARKNGVTLMRVVETEREDHTTRIYELPLAEFENVAAFVENPRHPNTDIQKCVPLFHWRLINTIKED
jgi:hypothetical protein